MPVQLVLIRHGVAKKREEDIPDVQRPLTTEGTDQAATTGRMLSAKNFAPDLVVVSDAFRTIGTATRIVACIKGRIPPFVQLPALRNVAPTREEFEAVIRPLEQELGDTAEFRKYLGRDPTAILMRQAEVVAGLLLNLANANKAKQVLVVGHHLNLNAICRALVGGEKYDDIFLGPFFGPAEGCWIHEDGSVTLVKGPKSQ